MFGSSRALVLDLCRVFSFIGSHYDLSIPLTLFTMLYKMVSLPVTYAVNLNARNTDVLHFSEYKPSPKNYIDLK